MIIKLVFILRTMLPRQYVATFESNHFYKCVELTNFCRERNLLNRNRYKFPAMKLNNIRTYQKK